VIDLFVNAQGGSSYGRDSLTTVFSSGKSVAAILLGIQKDRGTLNFEDKIAQHWPAFAQNGK